MSKLAQLPQSPFAPANHETTASSGMLCEVKFHFKRHRAGFRVLKSEIEIAPVFYRLPERIKAHASICMLALILYRVMRQRLKMSGSDLSTEAALADLRRIQRHSVSINNAAPIQGVSSIVQRQTNVLAALKIKKPSHDNQLNLS